MTAEEIRVRVKDWLEKLPIHPDREVQKRMSRAIGRWNGPVRLLLTSMARQAMPGGWLVEREDELNRLRVDWSVSKTHETRVGKEHWLWMVRLCFDRQGIPSHFEVFSKSKRWDSTGPPAHGTFCADLSELELNGALEKARRDGPVHGLIFYQGHMPLWITL